ERHDDRLVRQRRRAVGGRRSGLRRHVRWDCIRVWNPARALRSRNNMKRVVWTTIIALSCGAVWHARAQSARPAPVDWVTDGNDNQRTGWQRNETILTKKNVRNLKILWKIQTGNQVRALHSLMPVLIIGRLNTANGPREVGIVNGISDNLYAFDVEAGKIIWQQHWNYTPPPATG